MSCTILRWATIAVLLIVPCWASQAAEPASETCGLRVSEARLEVGRLREFEQIAPIESTANQGIFDLLEPLFAAHAIEELRYLEGKRDRDRSRILVVRSKIATQRALARVEVLTKECFSGGAHSVDSLARFEALGCELIAKDEGLAIVDAVYYREVLAGKKDLRSVGLATAQELISAEFELDRAELRIRSRQQRFRECVEARG